MVAKFIWQLSASFHSALCHKRRTQIYVTIHFEQKRKHAIHAKQCQCIQIRFGLAAAPPKKKNKQQQKTNQKCHFICISRRIQTHTHTRPLLHCCVTDTKRLSQTCRISHWNFKPILIVISPHKRLSIDTKITNCWRRFRLWFKSLWYCDSNATAKRTKQSAKCNAVATRLRTLSFRLPFDSNYLINADIFVPNI